MRALGGLCSVVLSIGIVAYPPCRSKGKRGLWYGCISVLVETLWAPLFRPTPRGRPIPMFRSCNRPPLQRWFSGPPLPCPSPRGIDAFGQTWTLPAGGGDGGGGLAVPRLKPWPATRRLPGVFPVCTAPTRGVWRLPVCAPLRQELPARDLTGGYLSRLHAMTATRIAPSRAMAAYSRRANRRSLPRASSTSSLLAPPRRSRICSISSTWAA